MRVTKAAPIAVAGFLSVSVLAIGGEDGKRNLWSGVYTQAQADHGEAVYAAACGRCHREESQGAMALRGERFVENWREDSLGSLWNRITKTMPAGAPGSLKESEYLAILAYILQQNNVPAGGTDLTASAIPQIRFEGKDGPQEVPDFALIQTVGCLVKSADGVWHLQRATEPKRTREPGRSSANELQDAAQVALGAHSYRLLDGSGPDQADLSGKKAKVKGLLIRKPNDDRLNATSVEGLGQDCR